MGRFTQFISILMMASFALHKFEDFSKFIYTALYTSRHSHCIYNYCLCISLTINFVVDIPEKYDFLTILMFLLSFEGSCICIIKI